MSEMFKDIHFEGCKCDECDPFNAFLERVHERVEEKKLLTGEAYPEITSEDLFGDQDTFNFDAEANLIIQNRRNESMERDCSPSVPTVTDLQSWFNISF